MPSREELQAAIESRLREGAAQGHPPGVLLAEEAVGAARAPLEQAAREAAAAAGFALAAVGERPQAGQMALVCLHASSVDPEDFGRGGFIADRAAGTLPGAALAIVFDDADRLSPKAAESLARALGAAAGARLRSGAPFLVLCSTADPERLRRLSPSLFSLLEPFGSHPAIEAVPAPRAEPAPAAPSRPKP